MKGYPIMVNHDKATVCNEEMTDHPYGEFFKELVKRVSDNGENIRTKAPKKAPIYVPTAPIYSHKGQHYKGTRSAVNLAVSGVFDQETGHAGWVVHNKDNGRTSVGPCYVDKAEETYYKALLKAVEKYSQNGVMLSISMDNSLVYGTLSTIIPSQNKTSLKANLKVIHQSILDDGYLPVGHNYEILRKIQALSLKVPFVLKMDTTGVYKDILYKAGKEAVATHRFITEKMAPSVSQKGIPKSRLYRILGAEERAQAVAQQKLLNSNAELVHTVRTLKIQEKIFINRLDGNDGRLSPSKINKTITNLNTNKNRYKKEKRSLIAFLNSLDPSSISIDRLVRCPDEFLEENMGELPDWYIQNFHNLKISFQQQKALSKMEQ